ncbi:ABC transporter permease [Cereibacter johrii]|uniref:ABC-type nitrate/sulfonate/bicarbonate transport system permease component n=1 Tax=Cereibacter johrii TaxID=445629 RepID=A0ABX5J586_9RHOB|nr:ABC transporter permease subunit [Cereibacter johrii]ODM41740.1 ABC transporter permease [Cereibacter johrii]PTM78079.1 ABC-type nitrate/sulfonate/bicarbonate transport system permease component [Cereibacter johrii]
MSGRLLVGLLLLLLWEMAARTLAGTHLLAGPVDVAGWLFQHRGLVGRALAVTAGEAALGLLLGTLAAVLLAALAVLAPRRVAAVISLLMLFLFCLPLVATGPLLRVLWGPGLGPQVTLAALAVTFTSYLALLVGLRAAPPVWLDLVRSYGRGRLSELWHVRARGALPYVMAGLQIAAPAAFLGALVGEFTGAERGLGLLVIRALRELDAPATWGLATVAAGVTVAAHAAIAAVGRRLQAEPPLILAAAPGRLEGPLPVLAALALGLFLWAGAMEAAGLSPFFAKRPWDVWAFLFTDPEAMAHRAELALALAQTLRVAVPGYLAGLLAGAGLAALVILAPRAEAAVLPVAVALRAIPIVTTAPLLVLALGRGPAGTVTIVAVMIFFPTLVACLQGMRQTPRAVLDLFESHAAGRGARLLHAQLPAMLPAFFASARMAVPAAILAATTAEWLATGTGLGALMAVTASTSAYGMLWSATLVIALAACLAWGALGLLERAVLSRTAAEQLA